MTDLETIYQYEVTKQHAERAHELMTATSQDKIHLTMCYQEFINKTWSFDSLSDYASFIAGWGAHKDHNERQAA